MPDSRTADSTDPAAAIARLRADGFRFCHNRSARKHRRLGHEVRFVAGGLYAWRKS
jgi:hypothetical protein